ncbi:MAG: hypothetical protein Q4P23_01725 [Micrococcaceae bacterium]|nr:hypothetical protein [Micrococcaceae bacterium]
MFMLGVAWLQLIWSGGFDGIGVPAELDGLVGGGANLVGSGIVLNTIIVVVYIIMRTVGNVMCPDLSDVEPAGFGDTFCAVCAVCAVIVLLSIALVAGGPETVMVMKARTALLNQISAVLTSAADEVRVKYRGMASEARARAMAASRPPGGSRESGRGDLADAQADG